VEEFRRLSFECMSNELKDPTNDEQQQRHPPKSGDEKRSGKQKYGQKDQGNADGMAQAICSVLMAARVLSDPIVPGASEEQ